MSCVCEGVKGIRCLWEQLSDDISTGITRMGSSACCAVCLVHTLLSPVTPFTCSPLPSHHIPAPSLPSLDYQQNAGEQGTVYSHSQLSLV